MFVFSQNKIYTYSDYTKAEQALPYYTQNYVDHGDLRPHWLNDHIFWYRDMTSTGSQYILVDAQKGIRTTAFDHDHLATSLSTLLGKRVTADMLPFSSIDISTGNKYLLFDAGGKHWKADLSSYAISPDEDYKPAMKRNFNEVLSPDKTKAAYIKDYNLWIRDVATNKSTQLTTDGVKNFGYATDNAGWKHSDAPILRWSDDSKKIATFQQDERLAGDMYLVQTTEGHPELHTWKYPLPGDSNIITIQRVIIDVDNPKVIRLQVPPDPHRATLSDDISSSGTFDDVDWNADNSQLAFVSTSRDHKIEKFRIADANTGTVREVFTETVPTQYESGQGAINWRYLSKTNEIIWYSERDNWGHLYLYDANTGKLKNQITKGDYVVTRLLKVDQKNRVLYYLAVGNDAVNPYFEHFYKIDFDGKNKVDLTPEAGNHRVSLSPDDQYFIDDYSQPNIPDVMVLKSLDGRIITPLEKTNVSRLEATGWQPPKPIKVKAYDGVTDLYGLMFTPPKMDPTKKYPVIVYIYPGPQGGSVGNWSFAASRGDNNSLASLGFVVVLIEGTSNPLRSKSFHDMSYGKMAMNTLPDQVNGVRQLAQIYPYMDTSRVGIWGHSGGGFATACAMFTYPDFFKVGISESGNHDNRVYEDDWGERYNGLLVKNADGSSNYTLQANQAYAKNLKGKLLLAHGMMDDNVPPYNTLLVVEALEKANKDYDLIIFPSSRHGYGMYSLYMMRRRWDYFVQNLMGATPPKEFEIKFSGDPRNDFK
ncbi:MAG: DPP IV N-terminal domain-containing protein [Bacteroidetes bacterium]|nr:DPP IV N-terminal domain-containing protein [Bacteroidota bacterium]